MKVDCHRHLGGSIPVEWVWQTIEERDWSFMGETIDDVKSAMTFSDDEPRSFHRFLDKFNILNLIKWDENLIDSSIAAVCRVLRNERLDYCWMDFSINKYMDSMDWHKKDAIKFIYDAFDRYCPGGVGLVLSIKYEALRAGQRQYAKLIDDTNVADLLLGIDLVGDETMIDSKFHGDILRQWSTSGKMVRAHVGEFGPHSNIGHVLPFVTNIAHGLKIVNDSALISCAVDKGIVFDLGLTSNFVTNVIDGRHPILEMLSNGIAITLGADDPVICNTSLRKEYELASAIGVTNQQLLAIKQNAIIQTQKFVKDKVNLWETRNGSFGSPTNHRRVSIGAVAE